jgi:hypothetical protein
MQRPVSSIWQRLPSDLAARTERCVQKAREHAAIPGEILVFFRADDIAVPGRRFARLLLIFERYRVPLCLAVVPAWLTPVRWQTIQGIGKNAPRLWCWHQHGWRHTNHEVQGKKQEFGPGRSKADLAHDIRRGRKRLQNLMGKSFYPVFTPPWNRCGPEALEVLKIAGYLGISRSRGSRPASPPGLPSLDVNVDLHTRKEKTPAAGWENLFAELHSAIASGRCGVMIHHQRMNDAAFDFLEILLGALTRCRALKLVHFKDLEYTAPQ